jgi:hypothetical protein
MEDVYQDCFVVFVRDEAGSAWRPDAVEREVATCYSYDEAARVGKRVRDSGKSCVIRCVGQAGGGD